MSVTQPFEEALCHPFAFLMQRLCKQGYSGDSKPIKGSFFFLGSNWCRDTRASTFVDPQPYCSSPIYIYYTSCVMNQKNSPSVSPTFKPFDLPPSHRPSSLVASCKCQAPATWQKRRSSALHIGLQESSSIRLWLQTLTIPQ